jgi:hypothetical protein
MSMIRGSPVSEAKKGVFFSMPVNDLDWRSQVRGWASQASGSAVLLAFWVAAVSCNAAAQILRIDSTQVCKIPLIRHDSLFFTLDVFGRGLPKHYWYYFDRMQSAVVVELFDVHVDEWETAFPSGIPFKGLRAKTAECKMALTGVETRLLLTVGRGENEQTLWNNSVELHGGYLRVTIGKTITKYAKPSRKKMKRP